MKLSIPDYIASIAPYKPGKPLDELARETGITHAVKLASNENPIGPSPAAIRAIQHALIDLHRYPDGSGHALVVKLADKLGIDPGQIVLGNGSDDIIGILTRALVRPGDEVIVPSPSFLMYDIMVRCSGAVSVVAPLKNRTICIDDILAAVTPRCKMIFLCNPNNPTGSIVFRADFEKLMTSLPQDIIVVVDEAYMEFVRDSDCARSLDYDPEKYPIVTLRTFSKAYGLAGLRIGYGVMSKELADILHRVRQPFNTNSLAQIAANAALDDDDFLRKTIDMVHDGLDYFYAELGRMGVRYFPTQANFMLIDVGQSADAVFEKLLHKGVIVRSMRAYSYPDYIRDNVGQPLEKQRFIQSLESVMLR
ncbi:MAG: histidinol-phosphate transaminase [Desulfatirhabdiaceae bacterium]